MENKNQIYFNLLINPFVIALIIFLASNNSNAKEAKDWRIESDIPIEKCDIQTISSFYSVNNIYKQAEYAKIRMPLIEEQMKLVEKLPNKKQPVGKQFTKEQFSKFNQNREKQIIISLQTLLESNRARDVEVIWHMVEIADKNYRFNSEVFDKKHSDYFFQDTINTLRALEIFLPNKSEISENANECSINFALIKIDQDMLILLGSSEATNSINLLMNFKSSHGGKNFDVEKLNEVDKKNYEKLTDKVMVLRRAVQYSEDMKNLILFNAASTLIYKSGKKDFEMYGESQSYGKTINAFKQNTNSDKRTVMTINLIQNFNESYPSDVLKETKEIVKLIEDVTK